MQKVIVSWSGGKDSALAFYRIQQNIEYSIAGLLTIVFKHKDGQNYVGMHMIDVELIKEQAKLMNVDLFIIEYTSQETYADRMRIFIEWCNSHSITGMVFGDIFLDDLRKTREDKLSSTGIKALFPLWGISSKDLLFEFDSNCFKAIVVNVDSQFIDKSILGTELSFEMISKYNIDHCGENGEFHSLVYSAPMFCKSLAYRAVKIVSLDDNQRFYSLITQSIINS